MSIIGRFTIWPAHAQIQIRDTADAEFPPWETGEEPVVANAQCIVVATRGDEEGHVTVEVRRGPGQHVELDQWRLIFEGELLLTGEHAIVGSYLGSDEHLVRLGHGWHPLRILAKPKDAHPAEFIVVFDYLNFS
jgi:hypothetical protein